MKKTQNIVTSDFSILRESTLAIIDQLEEEILITVSKENLEIQKNLKLLQEKIHSLQFFINENKPNDFRINLKK